MKNQQDELIPTRASLIKRLKDWKDQASWQDFFDTYWKLIYSIARKAGLTDAEAQDAVQDTLISVAKHMPNFKYDPAIGSFKGWLLKTARWRIVGQLRKRGRLAMQHSLPNAESTEVDPMQRLPDPAGDMFDEAWEAEWENNLLEAASSKIRHRIDPRDYQIFDFYGRKNWPAEKVADKFHVSVGNVYVVKHRVTELLKAEVERLRTQIT